MILRLTVESRFGTSMPTPNSDKSASSPSGKAELCKSSITSSNLVEASIINKSQPLPVGFFFCFSRRLAQRFASSWQSAYDVPPLAGKISMDMFTPQILLLTISFSALAGLLAGLLGIGGGVILVPLFLWLFNLAGFPAELLVHTAFGTSLCIIVPTAISSTLGHRKRGNVAWHQVFYLAAGGALGAIVGSSLAALLSGNILFAAFGGMQILVSLKLLFFHPRLPPEELNPQKSSLLLVGLAGGAFSAFFGVGGGVIAVPLMLIVLRLPIHLAVGNSSALIVVSALFGTISYVLHGLDPAAGVAFSLGYVNLLVAAVVAPVTMVCARLGVRLASRISQDRMVKVFAILLMLVGLKLMV